MREALGGPGRHICQVTIPIPILGVYAHLDAAQRLRTQAKAGRRILTQKKLRGQRLPHPGDRVRQCRSTGQGRDAPMARQECQTPEIRAAIHDGHFPLKPPMGLEDGTMAEGVFFL